MYGDFERNYFSETSKVIYRIGHDGIGTMK